MGEREAICWWFLLVMIGTGCVAIGLTHISGDSSWPFVAEGVACFVTALWINGRA